MSAAPADAEFASLVAAVLTPVRSNMAFESCVEQLGSAIQLGVFRTGERLPPERELAETMSVSRATLREAIAALRAAGFVHTTRGRGGGTVVAPREQNSRPRERTEKSRTKAEMISLLVFRQVIEPGACYMAASRQTTSQERALLLACLEDVEQSTDPEDYRKADSRLHLAFATAAGSTELSQASAHLQLTVREALAEIPFLSKNIEHSNEQHREIVRAILQGEPQRARDIMESHCDATAALLKGLLK
jgi:GntR family transcriptional repressor for pyruvate dehydrogenase complex